MAERVSDNAIAFNNSRVRGYTQGAYPVEDDYTIGFSWEGVSVTFQKRPGPDFVSQRTLTQSTIPARRDGKRKHYHRAWRGEEQTGHTMRAIYGHVDEDGVEHEPRVVATKPEAWRGTRSPSARGDVIEGDIEGEYHDQYWRAV